MILNKDEIRSLGLVEGASEERYRDCTYDLRIGTIEARDAPGVRIHQLPAHGIAAVISKEELRLPLDICAIGLLKTSLSHVGVLGLNTGMVDPGWSGPLSSFLVNVGNEAYTLEEDDVFLRITFFRLTVPQQSRTPVMQDRASYIEERREMFRTRLSSKFLDLDQMARKGGKKMLKEFWAETIKYVAVVAFGLAVLTFLLNYGNLWLAGRWTLPMEPTRADVVRQYVDGELKKLNDDNRKLREEVEALKAQQINQKTVKKLGVR